MFGKLYSSHFLSNWIIFCLWTSVCSTSQCLSSPEAIQNVTWTFRCSSLDYLWWRLVWNEKIDISIFLEGSSRREYDFPRKKKLCCSSFLCSADSGRCFSISSKLAPRSMRGLQEVYTKSPPVNTWVDSDLYSHGRAWVYFGSEQNIHISASGHQLQAALIAPESVGRSWCAIH